MTFGTEFWSAIAGAVVGGAIALGIQLIALRAARKERLAAKEDRKKALGHSIMFKVLRIHSNIYDLHLHLEQSYSQVGSNTDYEPFAFVLPLANVPADIHFSAEEMSLVLSLEDSELTNNLMSLDVIHNSLIDIFETYGVMRSDIQQLMPADMDGNIGESKFTHEQWQIVRPRMVAMNQILDDARNRAKVDYEESRTAMDRLIKTLNEKLKLNLKLEIKPDKIAALENVVK